MAGTAFEHIVDYEEDIQSALDKLRAEVFASGQYAGAELNPSTPAEALEVGPCGTSSILDIMQVSSEPGPCCAAPLEDEELIDYFGTTKPSVEMIRECNDFWGDMDRGMAIYVIIYEGDDPKSIFFGGYSFD